MKMRLLTPIKALMIGAVLCLSSGLSAQDSAPVYIQHAVIPDNLGFFTGPRLGLTVFAGPVADVLRDEYDIFPLISQFGWQLEWRFSASKTGPVAAIEVLPLLGGLEQGKFIPSLTALMGVRFPGGFEIGVGPNLTLTGFGVIAGIGKTFKGSGVNWPVNLAVMPSSEGVRITLLAGFNIPR